MKLNWNKLETGSFEASLSGILKSVSTEVRTLENEKQTPYRLATVNVEGKNFSALMYEKNFQHGVEIGDELLCKAIYDPARGAEILITVSHLVAATHATIEDFGFPEEVTEVTSKETTSLKDLVNS